MPFCDHRLVEYVFNVPWDMKETGGIEKGLLRRAVADLLPPTIAYRRKSIYPASPDPAYAKAVCAQMTDLLHRPDARLFDLIDRGALAAAFAADPMLPGMIGLLPSPYASAAFLLDVNEWLTEYKVRLV